MTLSVVCNWVYRVVSFCFYFFERIFHCSFASFVVAVLNCSFVGFVFVDFLVRFCFRFSRDVSARWFVGAAWKIMLFFNFFFLSWGCELKRLLKRSLKGSVDLLISHCREDRVGHRSRQLCCLLTETVRQFRCLCILLKLHWQLSTWLIDLLRLLLSVFLLRSFCSQPKFASYRGADGA